MMFMGYSVCSICAGRNHILFVLFYVIPPSGYSQSRVSTETILASKMRHQISTKRTCRPASLNLPLLAPPPRSLARPRAFQKPPPHASSSSTTSPLFHPHHRRHVSYSSAIPSTLNPITRGDLAYHAHTPPCTPSALVTKPPIHNVVSHRLRRRRSRAHTAIAPGPALASLDLRRRQRRRGQDHNVVFSRNPTRQGPPLGAAHFHRPCAQLVRCLFPKVRQGGSSGGWL